VSKLDRTGPKMGFSSPTCRKKCQKWIEQVQKWVLGARRVEKSDKMNRRGFKRSKKGLWGDKSVENLTNGLKTSGTVILKISIGPADPAI